MSALVNRLILYLSIYQIYMFIPESFAGRKYAFTSLSLSLPVSILPLYSRLCIYPIRAYIGQTVCPLSCLPNRLLLTALHCIVSVFCVWR